MKPAIFKQRLEKHGKVNVWEYRFEKIGPDLVRSYKSGRLEYEDRVADIYFIYHHILRSKYDGNNA